MQARGACRRGSFSAHSAPAMRARARACCRVTREGALYHAGMASRRLPLAARRRRGLRRGGALRARRAVPRRRAARRAPDPAWWAARRAPADAERGALAAAASRASPRVWPAGRCSGPAPSTVRAGGPGGHYAALRDNTTLETPPLAVGRAQQVLLITARAPVGSPLLHVTALSAPTALAHVARRPAPVGELGHLRVQRGGSRPGRRCGSCSTP